MKFLCICDGGNVRSYALAMMLKMEYGQEAIAVGRLYTSEETMAMLCDWADWVVIMQAHMEESIPVEFKPKLLCFDVGEDRYGFYVHPELLPQVRMGAKWLVERNLVPA